MQRADVGLIVGMEIAGFELGAPALKIGERFLVHGAGGNEFADNLVGLQAGSPCWVGSQ
jgi:hypothetical protein